MRTRLLLLAAGAAGTLLWGGRALFLRGPAGAGKRPPLLGGSPPMPAQRSRASVPEVRVEEAARGLEVVWAIRFAPDGRMLVVERPGRVRVLRRGDPEPRPYLEVPAVARVPNGEGGLMGLALHPRFPREPYLYLSYTCRKGARTVNRISRFTDRGGAADSERVLLDDIDAHQNHNGGALAFGPDGMLYAGTGDAWDPAKSQDLESPNGKILRLDPEGGVPADNPLPGSPVYAYGFRNVTGLAWHPETGELWAASHGPSGEFPDLHARDTVHVVRPGGNHGWPLVVGVPDRPDLVPPVLYYPEESVPPGGLLFYRGTLFPEFRGTLFLSCLARAHLQRITVRGGREIAAIERWWTDRYGRLRALEEGPDGAIYFGTSNADGRHGSISPTDSVYRVTPADRR